MTRTSFSFGLCSGLWLIACLLGSFSVSVSQTPPKTKLTRKDRSNWLTVLKVPADCEQSFQSTYQNAGGDFSGLEFHRLGGNRYLVAVSCSSGAYQPGFIYAYYDESNPSLTGPLKLMGFESKDDNGKQLPYSLINGLDRFNPRTKELEIFSKYRGPGDCGLFVNYRFLGRRPVVVEARERQCKDGPVSRRDIDYRHWPKRKM